MEKQMILNWRVPQHIAEAAHTVVERAYNLLRGIPGLRYTPLEMEMDLIACHNHDVRLDFARLAQASTSDLMHDVLGIRRHIDRRTGKLGDCFMPRYAKR